MTNLNSNTKTHSAGLEFLSTYEQVDAQIAMHEAAIIRLKRRRIELSSISRLPPEVLCRVLLEWTESHRTKMADWTGVLRVCKHWREVALSCPQLWSNVTFPSPQWASTVLERSKQIPISVTITKISPKMEPVITDALSQVSRLKSLTVWLPKTSAFVQAQLSNMTGEASCLESIRFFTLCEGKLFSTLPATFLAGDSPRLRRVDMLGWLPQAIWSTPFLRGLTSLKWGIRERGPYDEGLPVAATSSAAFVRAELQLSNTIPTFNGLEGGPASLAHLKNLCLTGSAQTCASAMNCMALPSSATLEINCGFEQDNTTVNDSLALTAALHASWMSNPLSTSTPFPPFTSLQICDVRFTYPKLVLFVEDVVSNACAPPVLTIIARGSWSTLSHIAPALPLNNIRSLHLSLQHQRDVGAALFSQLPALASVSVNGNTAIGFIKVLKGDPAFQPIKKLKHNDKFASDSRVTVSYFAALKSLKMWQVDFTYLRNLEDLIDVLMWRYEHGGEIENLTLEACSELWAKDVARLREIVVDVKWDEVEQAHSDDNSDSDSDM